MKMYRFKKTCTSSKKLELVQIQIVPKGQIELQVHPDRILPTFNVHLKVFCLALHTSWSFLIRCACIWRYSVYICIHLKEFLYLCIHPKVFFVPLHIHPAVSSLPLHTSDGILFTFAYIRWYPLYLCIHQVASSLPLHTSGGILFTFVYIRLHPLHLCIHQVASSLPLHTSGGILFTFAYMLRSSQQLWFLTPPLPLLLFYKTC